MKDNQKGDILICKSIPEKSEGDFNLWKKYYINYSVYSLDSVYGLVNIIDNNGVGRKFVNFENDIYYEN